MLKTFADLLDAKGITGKNKQDTLDGIQYNLNHGTSGGNQFADLIPENTYVQVGGQVFQLAPSNSSIWGKILVPVNVDPQKVDVYQLPIDQSTWVKSGSIIPSDYQGNSVQETLSNYNSGLADPTRQRVLPNGQVVSGADALAQQQAQRDAYNAQTAANGNMTYDQAQAGYQNYMYNQANPGMQVDMNGNPINRSNADPSVSIASYGSPQTPQAQQQFMFGQVPDSAWARTLTDTQKQGIKQLLGMIGSNNYQPNQNDINNLQSALGASWQQYVPLFQGSSSGTGGGTGGTGGATIPTNYAGMPADILNSPEWNALSTDQKNLAYLTYKAQTATNDAQKQDALDALNKAKELADPYFREQIRMAQDELNRTATSTTADAQSKVKSLNDRISQLKEDLTFNKDQLTLEQQAEMASQLRKNQEDLNSLQQTMAEAGLAFSSPRQLAESNLMAEQQGMAESTARKYARLFRNEDLTASRGVSQAEQSLLDTNRQLAENLTSISRQTEAKVGSANLPGVDGVTPLGGVNGTLSEQNQKNVVDLQNILLNRQNPLNLV